MIWGRVVYVVTPTMPKQLSGTLQAQPANPQTPRRLPRPSRPAQAGNDGSQVLFANALQVLYVNCSVCVCEL